jgi:hypothetical protein
VGVAAFSFFLAAAVVIGGYAGQRIVMKGFGDAYDRWLDLPSPRDGAGKSRAHVAGELERRPMVRKIEKEFDTANSFAAALTLLVSMLLGILDPSLHAGDDNLGVRLLVVLIAALPFALFAYMYTMDYDRYRNLPAPLGLPLFVFIQLAFDLGLGLAFLALEAFL